MKRKKKKFSSSGKKLPKEIKIKEMTRTLQLEKCLGMHCIQFMDIYLSLKKNEKKKYILLK